MSAECRITIARFSEPPDGTRTARENLHDWMRESLHCFVTAPPCRTYVLERRRDLVWRGADSSRAPSPADHLGAAIGRDARNSIIPSRTLVSTEPSADR